MPLNRPRADENAGGPGPAAALTTVKVPAPLAPVFEAAQMISAVLEAAGLPWIACSDGSAAVRVVRERSAEIGLVLLDLSMPGLSGEQTFEELRRFRADLPVILSSGYAEAEATDRFAGHGLTGFIQKPYRPEVLLAAVRRALGGRTSS